MSHGYICTIANNTLYGSMFCFFFFLLPQTPDFQIDVSQPNIILS